MTEITGRLILTVCQRLEQAAKAAVEREGLDGVTIRSLPSDCDSFLADVQTLASAAVTRQGAEPDDAICVVGGPCLASLDSSGSQPEGLFIHRIDRRFHLFCDQPVAADRFSPALVRLVLESQLEMERKRARRTASRMNRQIADYAMAYDLMARLATVSGEAEAIENILDLFATRNRSRPFTFRHVCCSM